MIMEWLWIPVGAAVLVLLAAYYVYRVTFYADRRKIDDPYRMGEHPEIKIDKERIRMLVKEICETEHEDVQIVSFDGLKLRGRYYHAADGAPVHILLHGYRSLGARDFCGIFRIFREMGHNILMIDQRSHGASEGHVISFGIEERYDCLSWVNYAVDRFGKNVKIVLAGLSMGAATVLMASSLDLPDNVRGIIADSAYTSPEEIVLKVARDRKLPGWLIRPLARLGAYMFGHFGLNDSAAEREVAKCKIPVLLLHGEGDFFVPSGMSRKIFAACASEKQLEIFPNEGHCVSYIFHTERYSQDIEGFCHKVLSDALPEE